MKLAAINPLYLAGGVAAGSLLLWLIVKGPGGIAKTGSRAAVNTVGGLVEGTVKGIGDQLNIPDTNMTECQKAIAEGRTWDSSFACPAGTFIKSLFAGKPKPTPTDFGVGDELL